MSSTPIHPAVRRVIQEHLERILSERRSLSWSRRTDAIADWNAAHPPPPPKQYCCGCGTAYETGGFYGYCGADCASDDKPYMFRGGF